MHFKQNDLPFGVSFDLDGLDPDEIDALGTPVEKGIMLKDTLECFKNMPMEKFLGIEITEYNPSLDCKQKGVSVISQILNALPMDIELPNQQALE
jgi:arginase